jgi:hypothetical protein
MIPLSQKAYGDHPHSQPTHREGWVRWENVLGYQEEIAIFDAIDVFGYLCPLIGGTRPEIVEGVVLVYLTEDRV